MSILFPLPASDFDPTEAAIPWQALVDAGHEVVFATPTGEPATADRRILTGAGFGLWRPFLRATPHARAVYTAMAKSAAFRAPLRYEQMAARDYEAVVLTGGHAPGMRPYLESEAVQAIVARQMAMDAPVAAICHGVLVAARTKDPETGRSVLHGRRTTALMRSQEMTAWALTGLWLGRYYRTYAQSVQDEVVSALADPGDFVPGPFSIMRESAARSARGFVVRDGNYLSARFYGDAYRYADELVSMLAALRPA